MRLYFIIKLLLIKCSIRVLTVFIGVVSALLEYLDLYTKVVQYFAPVNITIQFKQFQCI